MHPWIPDTALVIDVQEAQDLVSFQTEIGEDNVLTYQTTFQFNLMEL